MPMTAKGVAKLIEECGELIQVLGKKLAYWDTDEHPDGAGSLNTRIEDEMADVRAAIVMVAAGLDLDLRRIQERITKKYQTFSAWDAIPDNNENGIDAHRVTQ